MTNIADNIITLPRVAPHAQLRTFVFTDTRLEALRPEVRERLYYDQRSPLAVRVTPAGAKTFVVYKWITGRPVKLKLGRVGEVTVEDARREAKRAVAAIAAGRDPAAERNAARAQGTTMAELWAAWRERKWHTLKPKTQIGFDSHWRNHIAPKFGNVAVNKLTRADLQKMIDKLVRAGRGATARKVKAMVHLLLAEAVRTDVVLTNVAQGVEVTAYVPRSRILLSHERAPLLAAIDAQDEPWAGFFRLLMLTACRVSNLYAMAWDDIDLEASTWRIPAARSKSGKTTVLPLVPDAVEILRKRIAQRAGERWVFPGRSKAGHVVSCRDAWAAVLDEAGIQGLTRHDLRRTLATIMAGLGVGDRVLAAALGHTSLSAVKVYVHLAGEIARGAMTDAAALLTRSSK